MDSREDLGRRKLEQKSDFIMVSVVRNIAKVKCAGASQEDIRVKNLHLSLL